MLASPPSDQPTPPQRIISIAPNTTDILIDINEAHRLVGVCKYCRLEPHGNSSKPIPRIGGYQDADLEHILLLKPDLIILRGQQENVEALARTRQIPILFDSTERLADIPAHIRRIGNLLQTQSRAEQLAVAFERRLKTVQQRVANNPKPRVFVTISRNLDELTGILSAGRDSFITDAITASGGENIFGSLDTAYPLVSLEEIIARKPDIILELLPERTDEQREALQRQVTEQWSQATRLPAVKKNRIYVLTDDDLLVPSSRFIRVIERLATLIHPEDTPRPNPIAQP